MINWTEANSIQQKTVEVKNVHRWDYLSNAAAWLGLLVARPLRSDESSLFIPFLRGEI